jgi:hypothetical protein
VSGLTQNADFFNLALLRAVGARERDHPAVEGWRTPNSASRRARSLACAA